MPQFSLQCACRIVRPSIDTSGVGASARFRSPQRNDFAAFPDFAFPVVWRIDVIVDFCQDATPCRQGVPGEIDRHTKGGNVADVNYGDAVESWVVKSPGPIRYHDNRRPVRLCRRELPQQVRQKLGTPTARDSEKNAVADRFRVRHQGSPYTAPCKTSLRLIQRAAW